MRPGLSWHALSKRLKFKHLMLLDTLAETRNMHVAAEHLNITQPAATKILQDVEQLFGFAMFERLPRDMRPTELGSVVIRFARQMLNATGRFIDELEGMQAGGYGNLLIGAIVDPAPDILSAAVVRIKEQRPLLMVRIVTQTSDQLLLGLEQKKLDLVIGRFTGVHQHNLFDFEPLTVDPLSLVAGPGHPLLRRAGLTFRDLGGWPWILHPLTSPTRRLLEEAFAEAGMNTPADIVETTSVFATLKLLQAGRMIALLPNSVVRDYVAHGLLAPLPVAMDRQLDDYGILTGKGEEPSGAAAEFIAIIRDLARHRLPALIGSGDPRPERV